MAREYLIGWISKSEKPKCGIPGLKTENREFWFQHTAKLKGDWAVGVIQRILDAFPDAQLTSLVREGGDGLEFPTELGE